MKKIKLCIVCSPGGHFYQTYQLKNWWRKFSRFWIIDDKKIILHKLKGEVIYKAYFPENRNYINALKNLYLAIKVLLSEKPSIIFSTGAGVAPPFFLIGKLIGAKLIYLETASYINMPTLTGKLVYPLSDFFLIQHKSSIKFYPKALYKGALV